MKKNRQYNGQQDKQCSTKHYTENERLRGTNPTKTRVNSLYPSEFYIKSSNINDQMKNKAYHTVRIIQNSIDWFGYNYPCSPIILSSWPPTPQLHCKEEVSEYEIWQMMPRYHLIRTSLYRMTGWGKIHRSKFQTKSLSYFHGNKLSKYKECFDKKPNLFNGI